MTIEVKILRIQAWTHILPRKRKHQLFLYGFCYQDYLGIVYKKPFLTPLLELVGKVLYLDTELIKR